MKRISYFAAVVFALGLTCGGAWALVGYVDAAEGLKSSLITFILTLGLALLGPAFLAAAVFLRRKNDARFPCQKHVPATPRLIHRPYLHGH